MFRICTYDRSSGVFTEDTVDAQPGDVTRPQFVLQRADGVAGAALAHRDDEARPRERADHAVGDETRCRALWKRSTAAWVRGPKEPSAVVR